MRNRATCKPAAITAVRSVGAEVHPGNIKEEFLLGGETTGIRVNKWPRRQGIRELEKWFGLWGASDHLRGQVRMGTMGPLTVMIPQPLSFLQQTLCSGILEGTPQLQPSPCCDRLGRLSPSSLVQACFSRGVFQQPVCIRHSPGLWGDSCAPKSRWQGSLN